MASISRTRSLVVGASGLIGSALIRQLGDDAVGTVCTGDTQGGKYIQFDITNERLRQEIINSFHFDTVYLAGGISSVDKCETHKSMTEAINVSSVISFIELLPNYVKVVYFSSGCVFDGSYRNPYTFSAYRAPINEYGKQKLKMESYLETYCPNSTIIRPVGVFGKEIKKKNFAYQIVRALTLGNEVHVPSDQTMNPVHSDDVAKWSIQASERNGIFHIGGDECRIKYQFAIDIARAGGLDEKLIIPTESAEMRQPAIRPKNGCLEVNIGESSYRDGLKRFFAEQ